MPNGGLGSDISAGVKLGNISATASAITVADNVVDGNVLAVGPVYTLTPADVVSGIRGDTIAYSSTFDGPFGPETFDDVKSAYNIISGTAGNIGAGYTYGAVRNAAGWSVPGAATAPDAFVDADWSVATGSGDKELDITIATLPDDGGATITDVEYDIDASDSWVSSGGTVSFTATMAASATSYAIRLRAVNSVDPGADGNSESATSGSVSYTQNLVDTVGTAHLLWSGGLGVSDGADMTFSAWIKPQTVGVAALFSVGGRSAIEMTSGGNLKVIIKDTANTQLYNTTSAGTVFVVGTLVHVYVSVDMAGDTLSIRVDDVDVMGDTGSFTGGSELIDLDRSTGILATNAGSAVFDCHASDIMLFNTAVSVATLWNGGTPPDPSAIGSPLVLLGSTMTETEWNDTTNLGSGGDPTGGSATFVDV